MTRNYKFRLYPTKAQAVALHELVDQHCDLYNAALEQRRDARHWQRHNLGDRFIGYVAQANELRGLRAACPELAGFGYSAQQQTLRKLDRAYKRFFDACKAGQRAGKRVGLPRFKPRSRFKSVAFPAGDGASFKENAVDWRADAERKAGRAVAPKSWSVVKIKGIGAVRAKQHRLIEGAVKQITVKRYASGQWYVVLSCVGVPTHPLPATGRDGGIDVGCAVLVATSDGALFDNPKHLKKLESKKKHHQRAQQRCKRGSNHWRETGQLRAAVEERIARQRRDNHFKIARYLVRNYDKIAREDLRIMSMTKSARGTIDDPGKNVAQKAGLNRSILDAAWGQFQDILGAVAEDAERLVWAGPAAHSSQECSCCHHVSANNRRTRDLFVCEACGHQGHADVNAAKTMVYRAGLAHWGVEEIISETSQEAVAL